MATAVLYLAGAIFYWVRGRRSPEQRAAGIILLAGGLRELDLHNRVTSAYALSSRYFVNGRVSLLERFLVAALLAGFALIALNFVRNCRRDFFEALKRREAQALRIAAGLFLAGFTVTLDRFQGFLRRNYSTSADLVFVLWVLEETLELFIPILFISAYPRVRPAAPSARRAAA